MTGRKRGASGFTNSLLSIYLHMWLNKKPGLTALVSRKIPEEIQMDSLGNIMSGKRSMTSSSTSSEQKSKKRTPGELMMDAMNNLVAV